LSFVAFNAVLAQRANFKAYKVARRNTWRHVESWLQALARSKSQDDCKSEDQHIKSIIAIEQQRRQARNVKRMNKKLKSLERRRLSLLTMKAFGLNTLPERISKRDARVKTVDDSRRPRPLHS
jgi:hypothetical protein